MTASSPEALAKARELVHGAPADLWDGPPGQRSMPALVHCIALALDAYAEEVAAERVAGSRFGDNNPPPHAVYRVQRGDIYFDATPCYGLHHPWWVPRNGFTKAESEPINCEDDDVWWHTRDHQSGQ